MKKTRPSMASFWVLIFITLFSAGLVSFFFLRKKNLLIVLMSFELMFFAVGVAFIYYSIISFDFKGLIYALVLLSVAAGEAAVGLAIIMMLFKRTGSIKVNDFRYVKF